MKKLKEKIVDFRKRHAKGLEKLNKGLNWFLIVIVTFIVGLFLVGTIKGCSDSLKNNRTDKSSERLVDSSKKGLSLYGDFCSETFQSKIYFTDSKLQVNTWYSFSQSSSVNYAFVPTSWQNTGKVILQCPNELFGSYLSDDITTLESENFTLYVAVSVISFDETSYQFESFDLNSSSKFNVISDRSTDSISFTSNFLNGYANKSAWVASLSKTSALLKTLKGSCNYLVFDSFPRKNCFVALSCFVSSSDAIPSGADIEQFPLSFIVSECTSAFSSNLIQPFFDKVSQSYQNGYQIGYDVGRNNGYQTGKTDGYNSGYNSGKTDGYTSGYNTGYSDGSNVDQKNTLQGLFLTAFQSPFHLFQQMFDVNVLGLNLGGLLSSLIVLLICAFVVKRLI